MIKYVGMKKIFVYFLLTCLSMTLAHAQGMPLGKDSLSDNKISVTVKTNAMALGMLTAAEEQAAQYKKRARNTVIFYIIAESIWQIKDLILYYYS